MSYGYIKQSDPHWRAPKSCGHKTRLSERDAWDVAKRFRAMGDDACHAYKCRTCGSWHVGYDKRQSQKRRQHHARV